MLETLDLLTLDLIMFKKTILGIMAAVAIGAVGMTTAHASIVSGNTNIDFTNVVYDLSLAGGAATYSFQNSGSAAPFVNAAIKTSGSALFGATFFGPSAFFTGPRAPFIDNALTFKTFPSFKEINYSSTDSFLALAFNLADGIHYGYARIAGTQFLGYGYETVANMGIQAGAVASFSVPEPGSISLVMLALGLVLTATARRRKS